MPQGWTEIRLGDLAEARMGETILAKELTPVGVPVYSAGQENVAWGFLENPKKILSEGTVVVSARGSIGFPKIPKEDRFASTQTTLTLRFANIELAAVACFWLKTVDWGGMTKGGAIPMLTVGDTNKLVMPLPPLNEQRRIVAKLEELLAKVDASHKRLAKIPVILKRFRQAVLAAACSGRLTADWREENPSIFFEKQTVDESLPDIPESWKWVKFGQLTTMFRSGSTEVPVNETTSFPILRSSSVRIGSVDFLDVRYLSYQQSTNPANFIQDFDLLFTRLSGSLEYVANCGLVRGLSGKKLQYPDRLFCARLKDQSTAPYLEICFGSPVLRDFITISSKSSAGHQRISMGAITEQPIPYPPLPEQQEIVRRVESFFTLADQLEARYQKAKTHVDKLTQSILAKAFRGELVPQDPNDEPAAVLLERIRTERIVQPPKMHIRGRKARN